MVALLGAVILVILVLDTHDVSAPQCTIGECYQSLFVDRKPLPKALKSYPDSSVAYLSKGTTDTSLQVVRFFGC
ncbi:hypothetical protein PC129_g21821 [Phytophthora cactorum]|nr:hypothetical protein PC113_g20492 [Phytophthora cactorum]KAG2912522.1 hypothetical protein PC114_g8859 [Phytophthora cactorum]KAG2961708.1 hypothetical protein PC118_g21820 [Phytophthora cactorum]KAG3206253.1 hypothetical protein PC129_g21821 [Phytophthora cactorum]